MPSIHISKNYDPLTRLGGSTRYLPPACRNFGTRFELVNGNLTPRLSKIRRPPRRIEAGNSGCRWRPTVILVLGGGFGPPVGQSIKDLLKEFSNPPTQGQDTGLGPPGTPVGSGKAGSLAHEPLIFPGRGPFPFISNLPENDFGSGNQPAFCKEPIFRRAFIFPACRGPVRHPRTSSEWQPTPGTCHAIVQSTGYVRTAHNENYYSTIGQLVWPISGCSVDGVGGSKPNMAAWWGGGAPTGRSSGKAQFRSLHERFPSTPPSHPSHYRPCIYGLPETYSYPWKENTYWGNRDRLRAGGDVFGAITAAS